MEREKRPYIPRREKKTLYSKEIKKDLIFQGERKKTLYSKERKKNELMTPFRITVKLS